MKWFCKLNKGLQFSQSNAACLPGVLPGREGAAEVQLLVFLLCPLLQPGAVEGHSQLPCAAKARLCCKGLWCWGSGFVAVTTSQAYLLRKFWNAKASCQHDTTVLLSWQWFTKCSTWESVEFTSPLGMLCCVNDVWRVNFLKQPHDFMVTIPSKSSGQWVLTKPCPGILWHTYPLEGVFVLSFSGPVWVKEKGSMKVQEGFPDFNSNRVFSWVHMGGGNKDMNVLSWPSLQPWFILSIDKKFRVWKTVRCCLLSVTSWGLSELATVNPGAISLLKSRKHLWCIYFNSRKKC